MPWTAKLLKKTITPDIKRLDIEFTDGAMTFVERPRFRNEATLEEIKAKIRQRLRALDDLTTSDAALVENALIDTAPTPPPPPPPLPADEQTFRDWLVFYDRLERAQRLVDLGVIPATAPKFVALKDKVQTDFQPIFLDKL